MMGFLKRLFGGSDRRTERRSAPAVMAIQDLERIESELQKVGAASAAAARLQNRAGDLHLARHNRSGALSCYGNAIDAYLKLGEYDNAMAVCRKIIRVVPDVIRTRRTMAWLCLGKGFLEIAREQIDAYVTASKEADLGSLAAQQLHLMAQYVDRADFREFLAEKLEELDDTEGAARVRNGAASDKVRAAGWEAVVFAALLTPDELRRAIEEGVDIRAPTREGRGEPADFYLFDPDKE